MRTQLFSSSIFFIWITFLFSIKIIPTSVFADNSKYTNCKKPFSCGSISGVKFPFSGGDRADYCGRDELKLTCQDNNIPKFTIDSVTYRILSFDPPTPNLRVARDAYYDNICPGEYRNTTFDPSVFIYNDGFHNMTLLYGCSNPVSSLSSQSCGSGGGDVYYVGKLEYIEVCLNLVIIPVADTYDGALFSYPKTDGPLQEALNYGFSLQWVVDSDKCNTCTSSNGECGYRSGRLFTCFCDDGDHNYSCTDGHIIKEGKKNTAAIAAGVSVGIVAVIAIALVLWLIRRRKKRTAERSKSNDLLMPPPSNRGITSVTSTTVSHSQSIPSNASSKVNSVQKSYYFGVQVFSYEELEEATNNFDSSMELGDGGFGAVYYGKLKDGRVVAVKRLYERNFKRVEQYMNEVKLLANFRHKNLVALYGCTSKNSPGLLLVYEYIPNGTVADHIHGEQVKSSALRWPVRLKIAVEIAEALAYLHKSDVIHRDVKTNNILLDNNFTVKVGDFGLSRLFPTHVTHVSTAPQGTPGYVDPEYYQNYQLTDKSDVYSFGVVLIELISSLEAVDVSRKSSDVNLASMAIKKIQARELDELVDPYLGFEKDDATKRMITAVAEVAFRCLQPERDARPSMEEVLEILKGIQGEEYGVKEATLVDIKDHVTLLKNAHPPFSPDSVADHRWPSGSTTASNSS